MKRAAIERQRTLNKHRAHLRLQHRNETITCRCEQQPGRFRKTERIGGCGNARCYLCHSDKLMKRPTLQQKRSDSVFQEWFD